MSHLQALWGLAMHGSRRLQQASLPARWAAAMSTRFMSSLPDHIVLGMPALSPTMSQGNLAKWHVKVGDAVSAGTLLADIETDKATMGFENQDQGHVAKLLVSEGAQNLPLGTPLLVLVEEAADISAFATYTGKGAAPAAPTPAAASPPPPAASSKPAATYPPHNIIGMPSLSPTMERGNIIAWKVKEGDTIKPGDDLAEIETDKATISFENQEDGVIAKILVPGGSSNIAINTPLLVIVENEALVSKFKNYTSPSAAPASAAPPAAAAPAAASKPKVVANRRLGPAARMLLEAAGLSVSDVTPSGPNDIVTKGDVLAAIEAGVKPGSGAAVSAAPAAAPAPAAPKPAAVAGTPSKPAPAAKYEDIPNTQIRKVIASRLLESKVTIPSLYGAVDVELDALTALRKGLAEQGVKLSVNDFVLKAIAAALKEVPAANSLWDSKKQESVPAPSIDISVAVATERGLITPIVKNADVKTVAQISKDVKELAAKAKANKLKPEEFQGGSFTVSNLGMFGVSYFSAIINPPQGAILAVGGTQPRVRLVDGKPKAYNVMTVTLSADHRMYDGELLGQVLESFKKHIQSPATLVM